MANLAKTQTRCSSRLDRCFVTLNCCGPTCTNIAKSLGVLTLSHLRCIKVSKTPASFFVGTSVPLGVKGAGRNVKVIIFARKVKLFIGARIGLRCTCGRGLFNNALDVKVRFKVMGRSFSKRGIFCPADRFRRRRSRTVPGARIDKVNFSLGTKLCCRHGGLCTNLNIARLGGARVVLSRCSSVCLTDACGLVTKCGVRFQGPLCRLRPSMFLGASVRDFRTSVATQLFCGGVFGKNFS